MDNMRRLHQVYLEHQVNHVVHLCPELLVYQLHLVDLVDLASPAGHQHLVHPAVLVVHVDPVHLLVQVDPCLFERFVQGYL